MAVNLSPVGGVAAQFFTNNGTPLSGGKIFTYTAGTTTPAATYTSSSGSTPHTNPIVLDSAGRVPNGGEIWLTDGVVYKFILKTSTDVLIATYDNITGINSNYVNYTNSQEIQTATAGQTVFTLTTMQYQPGTNSLSVFVDGVNQYGSGAQYAYVETDSTTVTFTAGLHVGAEVKFTTSAINASSYGDAFQISYTAPYTGSVATNVGDKLAQTVSVKDFGAVGDGVTDDTAAIQAAIDALTNGGSVLIPAGEYVISDSLTITVNGVSLVGQGGCVKWNGLDYIYKSGTVLTKKSTMNAPAIVSEGLNFSMLEIGVTGQNGNGDDGIYIKEGQRSTLTNVSVAGMGGNGIRIGTKGPTETNVSSWQLVSVSSEYNGEDGVYISDDSAPTLPNANTGTAVGLTLQGNLGNGLRIKYAIENTFCGMVSQQNTGYGVYLDGIAVSGIYTNFVGANDLEANTAGNWYVGPNVTEVVYVGQDSGAPLALDPDVNFTATLTGNGVKARQIRFSNAGSSLDTYYHHGSFAPTIYGATTTGSNTYVWQQGYYSQIGKVVTFFGSVRLSAKDPAMSGYIYIDLPNLPLAWSTPVYFAQCQINAENTTLGTGYGNFYGQIVETTRYIQLFKNSTTASANVNVLDTDISDTTIIYFSGSYQTQ